MIDTAFRNRLEAWFRRRVGDLSLAEDLTQETLLRALVGRDRAAAAGAVFHPGPAWWFKTARSVLIDAYRARGRRRSRLSPLSAFENEHGELALPAPDSLSPEGAAESAETALARCVPHWARALPPAYREVVTAGLAGGEPQSVWAVKRGLSPNTVKTRWARGKARLRALIEACCTLERNARGELVDVHPRRPRQACGQEECGPLSALSLSDTAGANGHRP